MRTYLKFTNIYCVQLEIKSISREFTVLLIIIFLITIKNQIFTIYASLAIKRE